MERSKEFEWAGRILRIKRTLANMDAKVSHLHDSTRQLQGCFRKLKDEIGEFVDYAKRRL